MAPNPRNRNRNSNRGNQDRNTQLSKALSLLLRHRAADDGVPISPAGFVRVSDALRWHRLRSLNATLEEVLGVVEANLRPGEKGRFGVRWEGDAGEQDGGVEKEREEGEGMESETRTETEQALTAFTTGGDIDAAHFLIRAVQGHSLRLEDAEALLSPITLENAPETVVHGTFYGAWERILKSGGLKAMGRMHVHCATGPAVRELLPELSSAGEDGKVEKSLVENRVRSGMRSDAQILIYIDIKRALAAGVPFWRSENGVILTEGSAMKSEEGNEGEKVLGVEFWDVVVEINRRLGVLWRHGEGVVKELPKELATQGMPRGKERTGGRGARGRGRGSGGGRGGNDRPKLMVERDELS